MVAFVGLIKAQMTTSLRPIYNNNKLLYAYWEMARQRLFISLFKSITFQQFYDLNFENPPNVCTDRKNGVK